MKIEYPRLIVSDKKGKIFALPTMGAAGMKGGVFFVLNAGDLIKMPPGSRLFMLPRRAPVGYDLKTERFMTLEPHLAVAAFTPPAFTLTYNTAYVEAGRPDILPLFSYAPVALYKNELYTTAIRVDKSNRHDSRFIDIPDVKIQANRIKKLFPNNRLIRHLSCCALTYGCAGAQNFFLGRHEGPLPVSPYCNASCAGCISYQPDKSCPETQPRIKFIPSPEEISETALFHINRVKNPIVSFGQGCEGEPLLAGDVIEKAIKMIRQNTKKGMIHMNTNASMPIVLSRLFDAGLDSIRVSLNSSRSKYYNLYYKPKRYRFSDVMRSIKIARTKGAFISINYLTMPGFTDSKDEFRRLKNFLNSHKIDMIQWRNLNFDPMRYFRKLNISPGRSDMAGISEVIDSIKKRFPAITMGYYNKS